MTRETWRDDIAEESIRNRARRGARACDEAFGLDWIDQIDDFTFDMSSPRFCVMAQLGEQFDENWPYTAAVRRAKERLGLKADTGNNWAWECSHGVEVQKQYGIAHSPDHTWSLLQKQWVHEIAKRRRAQWARQKEKAA